MTLTIESIDNGYMLYYPTYRMDYVGSCTYQNTQVGNAREYFPTLELALVKMADVMGHVMEGARVTSKYTRDIASVKTQTDNDNSR